MVVPPLGVRDDFYVVVASEIALMLCSLVRPSFVCEEGEARPSRMRESPHGLQNTDEILVIEPEADENASMRRRDRLQLVGHVRGGIEVGIVRLRDHELTDVFGESAPAMDVPDHITGAARHLVEFRTAVSNSNELAGRGAFDEVVIVGRDVKSERPICQPGMMGYWLGHLLDQRCGTGVDILPRCKLGQSIECLG